jgi:hypothetical protein
MKFDAFMGGSYESQARFADTARCVNWYFEKLQDENASAQTVLYPTPGVETISALLSGNGRAHMAINGREFAVVGSTLYEVLRDGGTQTLGTVALGDTPATISASGLREELFIVSGGNGYLYDLSTKSLTVIAALTGRVLMGDYLDGYFIALNSKANTFYISALGDGSSWTIGTDFAMRSLAADQWKAMKVVGRYLWLWGGSTTEVWQDTGATNFPFAPFPGSLFEYGTAAPFSAAIVGNEVVWLGRNRAGKLCFLRGTSPPSVISHYALESKLRDYTGVEETIGDAYADMGHSFYLASFEKANTTWCWDAETNLWSERGTWISELDRYTSWRPRFYAFVYDEHRMLDSSSGYIYRIGTDLTMDVGGRRIRRLRRAPAILKENERIFYSEFQLDLEHNADANPPVARFTMAAHTVIEGTVSCPGNPPCAGIVVQLRQGFGPSDPGLVEASTVTDAAGYYIFTDPVTTFNELDDFCIYAVANPPCGPCNIDDFDDESWVAGHHFIVNLTLGGA